jgi:cardiolipin synthase
MVFLARPAAPYDRKNACAMFDLAAALLVVGHVAIFLAVTLRILSRHNPPGIATAWLLAVLLFPLFGPLLYVAIGERRLGHAGMERSAALRPKLRNWLEALIGHMASSPAVVGPQAEPVARLAAALTDIPVFRGHRLRLLSDSDEILSALASDIDAAREFAHLEFYIWNEGGLVGEVVNALCRAAQRGVRVRAMMDGQGSSAFFKSASVRRLRAAGVEVIEVLPIGAASFLVARTDLRDHRKIAVFDNRVAYTGSLNLVDPKYFKCDAGVGEWVDAVVRLEGPACCVLNALSTSMAHMQPGSRAGDFKSEISDFKPAGTVALQVFPSGPGYAFHHVESMMMEAVYAAQRELTLTTPYFVPGDALVGALRSAALRGVRVTLILPEKNDSKLVQFASASYFDELLAAGVAIQRFRGGLLHTKSLVIDGALVVFGTANLDRRSFLLNFEVSLLIYDAGFAGELMKLYRSYLANSAPLDPAAWAARPARHRIAENAAALAAPLL